MTIDIDTDWFTASFSDGRKWSGGTGPIRHQNGLIDMLTSIWNESGSHRTLKEMICKEPKANDQNP